MQESEPSQPPSSSVDDRGGRGQDVPERSGARTTHRRGRLTETRLAILEELGPRYGLHGHPDVRSYGGATAARPAADSGLGGAGDSLVIDSELLDRRFGHHRSGRNPAVRVLDVGVGNGVATLALAAARPEVDIVAVELHRPGLAHLLRHLHDAGITDIAPIDADVETLLDRIRPGTFAEIRILFPDPWPKARHRKRRLIDVTFACAVRDVLPSGGCLHLATDWEDYADQMRAAIAGCPGLSPVVAHDDGPPPPDAVIHRHVTGDVPTRWRSDRPDRPVTVYEQRGLDAGRRITDLIAVRTT